MLRLRTLGGLSLESEGSDALGAAATQRRRLALLAILAVAGERGASRDQLVGALWPEVDEARARSALSQALYALKQSTRRAELVIGHDRLRLNAAVIACDVVEFQEALARGDVAHAANLYTGAFLDGVHLSDAPEFEHWVDGERLRLGRAAEGAIERLAVEAEERTDYAAAADWWRRLTVIDPLKTRAVLGLMSALAGAGDRATALRQGERYAALVREDLDAEPSATVMELAASLRGAAGQHVVDRYRIEREIGRGGMAIVYLARDAKHDRLVALKMLQSHVGAVLGRERLEREIRITARLQHPHILPLHDSGEWGGRLFYVMPFVDGESLRARLDRERQLPISDALAVAREVAEALDHAHRHGIVHQDVKPENILLAERHAIVADFGIARVVSEALDPGRTGNGPVHGTPAYMAPEQSEGRSDVGPAADIFALGCVLFEMITGRPPWIRTGTPAVLTRRLREPPLPLRRLRPDAPAWVDELLQRMLAFDPSARPAPASEVVRLLTTGVSAPPSNLPLTGDAMIGREDELRAGAALLDRDDVAVLTLTGAGGSGKTRLAVEMARAVAAHFERVFFVDLSAVNDRDAVLPAIAAATGVERRGARDVVDALASSLAGRRVLVVLDNFEQVVAAAPAIIRLVAAVPTLKLLVTSRVRLGIRAEHEFFVAPLSLPEAGTEPAALRVNAAVRLFVQRAVTANPELTFDDETLLAAARICARVDGLPLAIELAAARCRLLSPRAVAARLDAGFDLVSGGGRDRPERHQTIRQAVAWSLELLDVDALRAFGRCAVFAGGCTLAAAEAVCGGDESRGPVIDAIGALVDASLLMRDAPAHGDDPRLRMLQTVRELALETLAADPAAEAVADRHAQWYRQLASSLAPALTGKAQHEALRTLAAEHANFDIGLEHVLARGDADAALAYGAALWRYWLMRGHLAEGRSWLARVLAISAASDPRLDAPRADVMTGDGHLAQNTGAVDQAAAQFEAVLRIRRRLGDSAGVARTLADLGWIAWRRCDFPEARRLSTECLALAEQLGQTRVAGLALTNLGAAALFEGRFEDACAAFRHSVQLRARVADRRGVAFVEAFMGWTMCRAGQLPRARELLERAESTLRALGDERLLYFARDARAEVHLRANDATTAAAILEIDSIAGVRRFGDRWSVAHGLALASWASRLLGRLDQAAEFARESLELRSAEGDRWGEAECLALLAAVARQREDEPTAVALLQRSRAIRTAIGDTAGVAECDAELQQLAASA